MQGISLAGLGPASPMDVTERIAVTIVAQGDEFVALADIGGKSHTAGLITHGAGKRDGRQGITFGQNERALGQAHL